MSRYSKSFGPKSTQFWFVPSECPSNPLHFKGQSLLHNHLLLSLMGNSDFLSRPKFAIDSVKSWPSNCFFFVTSSLKSSIKFPTEGCLLVTQFEKKTPFWAESKAKMTESAQKFQLFDSHQNSNLLFFHKSKDWLFQKKTTKKITFVKKYSIEKPKISIITPEKPDSKKIQGVFL